MEQNEKVLELTWKEVFDTSKKMYGHIDCAHEVIVKTGYEYFVWNENVYETKSKKIIKNCKIL